ncbi:MAG: LolA family protein [Planctomycetota bacterium]|jgi:outer membrane lipoprotein-sorting protein
MDTKIITKALLILLVTMGNCWAGCCTKKACVEPEEKQVGAVDVILQQLSHKTKQLKSYQTRIEYKLIQPAIYESTTLRKGVMYYAKLGGKTKLRINFSTLKQDDEKEQKYREEFIFDGVWLTRINYEIKQVSMRQMTEPNKPVDAFVLASRNLPIVGFAKIEDLKKQYEIKLVEKQAGDEEVFIHLNLKVKPDSIYKDNYTSVDFWIDKKLGLPAKINAVSTEKDIYQIKLIKPQVNSKMGLKIFEFKVPDDFGKEIIPLKKNSD